MAQAETLNHVGDRPAPYRSSNLPDVKLLMWVFLASDCMMFGAMIGSYLVYKGRSLVGPYPLDLFDIPLTTIISFVLLMSSFLMVLAHLTPSARRQHEPVPIVDAGRDRLRGIFLGFQVFEFAHFMEAGLYQRTNLFGSSFYMLTGTHGIHVAVGVLTLIGLLIASYIRPQSNRTLSTSIAGLYWHFVDIVWIVIFTVVYLVDFV